MDTRVHTRSATTPKRHQPGRSTARPSADLLYPSNFDELGDITGAHSDLPERHVPQAPQPQNAPVGGRRVVHRLVHTHVTVHGMDTTTRATSPTSLNEPTRRPGFATPEGLRHLLIRLQQTGPDAWAVNPEAASLLDFCAHRYGALARRYRQTSHDAAVAAFEILRAAATVRAADPWAVVTRAVQLTLQADERADALLCSTGTARRLMTSGQHDVVRIGEREDGERSWTERLDRLARVGDRPDDASTRPNPVGGVAPGEVPIAVANIVELLVVLGWPRAVAANGLDYICSRVTLAGNPTTALAYLRRALTPLTLLDIPHRSWTALCRLVLGTGDGPGRTASLLRRVLSGEPFSTLLTEQRLTDQILRARPPGHDISDPRTDQPVQTRAVHDV